MRLLAGALVVCGLIQSLTAGEIVGILGSYTNDQGRSYLGFSFEKTLVLKTPDSAVLRSHAPRGAEQMVGQQQELRAQSLHKFAHCAKVSEENVCG